MLLGVLKGLWSVNIGMSLPSISRFKCLIAGTYMANRSRSYTLYRRCVSLKVFEKNASDFHTPSTFWCSMAPMLVFDASVNTHSGTLRIRCVSVMALSMLCRPFLKACMLCRSFLKACYASWDRSYIVVLSLWFCDIGVLSFFLLSCRHLFNSCCYSTRCVKQMR